MATPWEKSTVTDRREKWGAIAGVIAAVMALIGLASIAVGTPWIVAGILVTGAAGWRVGYWVFDRRQSRSANAGTSL